MCHVAEGQASLGEKGKITAVFLWGPVKKYENNLSCLMWRDPDMWFKINKDNLMKLLLSFPLDDDVSLGWTLTEDSRSV